MVRNRKAVGYSLIAISGLLLAIYPVKLDIQKKVIDLPDAFFTILLVVGLCLAVAGLVVVVSSNAGIVFQPIMPAFRKRYVFRHASRSELKTIHELCSEVFSGEVSPLRRMKKWYDKNPKLFWVVEQIKEYRGQRTAKFVAYFAIIPLRSSAEPLVRSEELDGTALTSEHIAGVSQSATAVYLGGIAAVNRMAGGVALHYMQVMIDREKENGVKVVYTRPVTKIGLELVRKYNFSPIHGSDHELGRVWEYQLS